MAPTRFPDKLPDTIPSPITGETYKVSLKEGLRDSVSLLGLTDHESKVLYVEPTGMTERVKWQVFWHETFHVLLWETGLHNLIQDKEEEAFCDAFGAYMTKLMERGIISVAQPAKRGK